MNTRRWLLAGLLFGVLWVFVRGAALTPTSLLANLVTGLAVGLPVAFVFRRLYEEEIDIVQLAGGAPYLLAYVAVFSKEVMVANLDVASRVLRPTPRFEPQVVFVPLRVQTAVGITTIANSITITPGTVTLDHDPDENALYVHMIDGRNPKEVVEPIRLWEDYALEIFDEERTPDDPPPPIRVHPEDAPPEPKTITTHAADPVNERTERAVSDTTDEKETPENSNDGGEQ